MSTPNAPSMAAICSASLAGVQSPLKLPSERFHPSLGRTGAGGGKDPLLNLLDGL